MYLRRCVECCTSIHIYCSSTFGVFSTNSSNALYAFVDRMEQQQQHLSTTKNFHSSNVSHLRQYTSLLCTQMSTMNKWNKLKCDRRIFARCNIMTMASTVVGKDRRNRKEIETDNGFYVFSNLYVIHWLLEMVARALHKKILYVVFIIKIVWQNNNNC